MFSWREEVWRPEEEGCEVILKLIYVRISELSDVATGMFKSFLQEMQQVIRSVVM